LIGFNVSADQASFVCLVLLLLLLLLPQLIAINFYQLLLDGYQNAIMASISFVSDSLL